MTKARKSRVGAELVEAMNEVVRHARGEIKLPTRIARVPDFVDVRKIRGKTGLSRSKFAARFGLDPRAVQDWEQRRRVPDRGTRILLKVIEKEPEAVERALAS